MTKKTVLTSCAALLLSIGLPLTACTVDVDTGDSESSSGDGDGGGDGNDEAGDGDGDGDGNADGGSSDEVVWYCLCDAECDGAFEVLEEAVCSGDAEIEAAVDIAVGLCALALEPECDEFDCLCECETDDEVCEG